MTPLENVRQHHENGEACISADWDWRIEKDKKILFGSSNSGPQIDRGLNEGSLIESISISGEVPELEMIFTGNLRLKSMVMLTGDPECG
ncbi:hypothetical protein [Desulfonema magnum]|uniref:hypothetical protein n=1 Tax=Desulfonema magnum TaxID=45655 RepID=UPI001A9B2BE3|nr:hypothetical protein [Desulfonema magnum]